LRGSAQIIPAVALLLALLPVFADAAGLEAQSVRQAFDRHTASGRLDSAVKSRLERDGQSEVLVLLHNDEPAVPAVEQGKYATCN